MKKLVIFDLDGTLLNTIGDLAHSVNYALSKYGFPVHEEGEYNFMVGNGVMKLFERALPEGEKTPENIQQIKELFIPYYNEHSTEYSKPYPGILALLEELKKRNIKTAVASNKYDSATRSLVEHYFAGAGFSAVFGQREGVPVKPEPDIIHDILTLTGISQKDTLFVGDSGVDMQTGLNAGVDTVGVTWGFRPLSELEAFAPAHIVHKPEEILDLL